MALRGYAAPLQTEGLPERVMPTNTIQRLNGNFAARQETKQMEDIRKERREGSKKKIEKLGEAEKVWQHEQKKVDRLGQKMSKLEMKRVEKLQKSHCNSKRTAVEKEFAKEMRKSEKEMDKAICEREKKSSEKIQEALEEWDKVIQKECTVAQKIWWIVISRIDEQPCPSDKIVSYR